MVIGWYLMNPLKKKYDKSEMKRLILGNWIKETSGNNSPMDNWLIDWLIGWYK